METLNLLNLSSPDFILQLATGMVCSCFSMKNDCALAVLTGPEMSEMSDDEPRIVFLLKHRKRDVALEQQVYARLKKTSLTWKSSARSDS